MKGSRRTCLGIAALIYGLKLVATTLTAGQMLIGGASNNLVPFRTIHELVTSSVSATVAVRQLGGNIVLLMPLAVLILAAGLSRRRALTAVAITSFAIELLQAEVVRNRTGDVDDVLLNLMGGALVVAADFAVRTVLGRRRRAPDR